MTAGASGCGTLCHRRPTEPARAAECRMRLPGLRNVRPCGGAAGIAQVNTGHVRSGPCGGTCWDRQRIRLPTTYGSIRSSTLVTHLRPFDQVTEHQDACVTSRMSGSFEYANRWVAHPSQGSAEPFCPRTSGSSGSVLFSPCPGPSAGVAAAGWTLLPGRAVLTRPDRLALPLGVQRVPQRCVICGIRRPRGPLMISLSLSGSGRITGKPADVNRCKAGAISRSSGHFYSGRW